MKSSSSAAAIKHVRENYAGFFPGNPFDYFFLDEYYNQQYFSDEQFGKVFGVFSFLSVFITILGTFGLSAFMCSKRTREIGIRKVLGANVSNILDTLFQDFLVLIVTSFIIALPLTYYGLTQWLNTFANRLDLEMHLFLTPLAIVTIVTLATISAHIIKAAFTNPADVLKYE